MQGFKRVLLIKERRKDMKYEFNKFDKVFCDGEIWEVERTADNTGTMKLSTLYPKGYGFMWAGEDEVLPLHIAIKERLIDKDEAEEIVMNSNKALSEEIIQPDGNEDANKGGGLPGKDGTGKDDRKAKKADNGSKWNVEEILRHCTLEDNVLKLPSVQFNKKSYLEAKKWIEEAGGTWTGGKVQGFTFPFDATRVFSVLHEGKRCNLKQDYQFFETPKDVADWLVMIAGGIEETDTVLEPSAGRGALVKAIHRSCPSVMVDCYELMPENKQFLSSMENTNIIGDDFTKGDNKKYTKIIANPPFSGNQDIKHVRMMFDLLENGGTLASITSAHWEFASETVCIDFRQWLKDLNANVYVINDGEFKESGTSIETRAIVIKKTQNKAKRNLR